LTYDVIVIGAGASGLMAAIAAARCGSRVLVIEKKDAAGKKILATGNGKCNFTNMLQTPECYRSENIEFVMKVLSDFDVSKTISFFKELGIYPKERNGYLYPNSEQASSVVKTLTMECKRLNVEFSFGETVKAVYEPFFTVITEARLINPEADKSGRNADNKTRSKGKSINEKKTGKEQELITIKKSYYGKRLILAAGGCASPKLGSDGSGFELARAFGHSIIKPLPALVQLRSPDKYCKSISGVRTEAAVKLLAEGRLLACEKGELLFTDYGISGIPVLQVSRFAAKALDDNKKVILRLDLLPSIDKEELTLLIKERCSRYPDRNLEEILVGLLNNKLAYTLIKEAGLDPGKPAKGFNQREFDKLTVTIKEFNMNINGTNSFEEAQVCAGGIDTSELDAGSMESRLVKGLYFAGEILDVDGTCGGYNLQWAWSSGYLAGRSAGQKA